MSEKAALEHALWYARLGWPVFPVHANRNGACTCRQGSQCPNTAKHPRTRNGFKAATTDAKRIRAWWKQWPDANIGIATGAPSGLVVIDLDGPEGGQSMKAAQQRLGKLPSGPVAKTGGGGWHLLFKRPDGPVRSRTGVVAGIDVRADGGYIVAPPSIHASGETYRWHVQPEERGPPELPKAWLDWLAGRDVTQSAPGVTQNTEHPGTSRSKKNRHVVKSEAEEIVGTPANGAVREAIEKTLPTGPGQRNDLLFLLARRLKAIPELANRPVRELRPYVREWHKRALPYTRVKSWDTLWELFTYGWANVKYPWGTDVMTEILERANTNELPAVAFEYETPELRLLIGLCRELQQHAGDEPFFLSTHKAGELLGGLPAMTLWRWLNGLCRDDVLLLVTKGDRHRASEYRYIGGD